MNWLCLLARGCAVLAGLLLSAMTVMTCASLVGRNTTGWTIAGDFELTGIATGAAIALFMPLCQIQRGHLIVDFFTARASASAQNALDRLGAGLLAAMFALLAWRTALGGLNAFEASSGTMMLGFPEWIVYATMAPPFVLSSLIAGVQAVKGEGHKAERL